jgi:hypothetical protein
MSKSKEKSPGYCDAEWLDYNTGEWHRCAIVIPLRLMRPVEKHQADSFIVKDELGRLLKLDASEVRLLSATA